jgi:hypothetical protein
MESSARVDESSRGEAGNMPGQGRLGDKANVPIDTHGCPACPHPGIGPAIMGSSDVNVNRRPALRVDDPGLHAACCGPNTWTATKGSMTVFINGKGAHRMGDQNRHCGGMGQLVEGSPNVIVGESGGGGGGGSSGGGTSAGRGGGGGGSGGGGSGGGGGGGGGGSSGGSGGPGSSSGNSSAGSSGNAASNDHPVDPDTLEVHVLDAASAPVKRVVAYELTLPDGSKRTGQTDASGVVKITSLTQRGNCTLVLPDFEDPTRKSS